MKKKIGIIGGKPRVQEIRVEKVYKDFLTVEELMKEPFLDNLIKEEMRKIGIKRNKIARTGQLKRDAFNVLQENRLWTLDGLKKEYIEIYYRRSKLSSNVREYIKQIVTPAAEQTINNFTITD